MKRLAFSALALALLAAPAGAQVLSGGGSSSLVLSTNNTWTGTNTFNNSFILGNTFALQGLTTGALAVNMVAMDSGNNINIGSASSINQMQIVPGTGKEIRFLNAAASAYIIDMNDSRQVTFGNNVHDSIWTFYDSTAVTGDSAISIRDGAARGSRIRFGNASGTYDVGFSHPSSGNITVNDGGTTLTGTGSMTMLNLSALGSITNAGITTDSGQTATATVCEDTTTHQYYFGSGTGGICKGTSGRQFKRDIREIADLGLADVIALAPKRYYNREGIGLDSTRQQVGLIADEVREHLPDCADDHTVDYLCVAVVSLNAIKALAAEVEDLKHRAH